MRYTVNEKRPFIAALFERTNGGPVETQGMGHYIPWEHKLIKIHVELLTCAEHHKVPDYLDDNKEPELKYDGFIFVNDKGERWHNQYPRASYGQTTDTADRIVTFDALSKEEVEAQWDTRVFRMEDGLRRLDAIHSGIFEHEKIRLDAIFRPELYRYTPEEIAGHILQLQEFGRQVQAVVEEAMGQKIVVDLLTYGPEKKWLKGHYRSRFITESASDSHME